MACIDFSIYSYRLRSYLTERIDQSQLRIQFGSVQVFSTLLSSGYTPYHYNPWYTLGKPSKISSGKTTSEKMKHFFAKKPIFSRRFS